MLEQGFQRLRPRIRAVAVPLRPGRRLQRLQVLPGLPEQRRELRFQARPGRLELPALLRQGALRIPLLQPFRVEPVQHPDPARDPVRPLLQLRPHPPQRDEIPPGVRPAKRQHELAPVLRDQLDVRRVAVAEQHGRPLLPDPAEQLRGRGRAARRVHPQAQRVAAQAGPQPAARVATVLRPHVHDPRGLVPVHQRGPLLARPDGLLQRLEPSQEIARVPQQGPHWNPHPAIRPLPLERSRRAPLPVHLHEECHPHAQAVARAAEQRRFQRRDHCRHRLALPLRARAGGPKARSADRPHVPLHLDFDPLAGLLAIAAEGLPAVGATAAVRRRLVQLLAQVQARPLDPRRRRRSRLPAALPLLPGSRSARRRSRRALPAVTPAAALLAALPERGAQQLLVALLQARVALLQLRSPTLQLLDPLPRCRQLPLQLLDPRLPLRLALLRPRVHAPPVTRLPLLLRQLLQQRSLRPRPPP